MQSTESVNRTRLLLDAGGTWMGLSFQKLVFWCSDPETVTFRGKLWWRGTVLGRKSGTNWIYSSQSWPQSANHGLKLATFTGLYIAFGCFPLTKAEGRGYSRTLWPRKPENILYLAPYTKHLIIVVTERHKHSNLGTTYLVIVQTFCSVGLCMIATMVKNVNTHMYTDRHMYVHMHIDRHTCIDRHRHEHMQACIHTYIETIK